MKISKRNHIDFFIFLFGGFLLQSKVLFGFNLSISDLILVWIYAYFIFKRQLAGSFHFNIIFFIIFIVNLFSTLYMTFSYNIALSSHRFTSSLIKFFVNILYLNIGYTIAKRKKMHYILNGILLMGILISLLGFLTIFFSFQRIRPLIYYSNFRLSGLMNDPNYFAVLQIVSLMILLQTNFKRGIKTFFSFLIVVSIMLSSSKTGIISLIIFVISEVVIYFKKSCENMSELIKLLVLLMFVILVFSENVETLTMLLEKFIPGSNRFLKLFQNFSDAVVSDGSGRSSVWMNAVNIFKLNPIFGVGLGMYTNVGINIFGVRSVAHNTFLQLLAEWGLFLTFIFISYIFYIIYQILKDNNDNKTYSLKIISIKVLFVLSLGSLSISLNNARIFWLIIGIIDYYSSEITKQC